jgi:hypothetical protein
MDIFLRALLLIGGIAIVSLFGVCAIFFFGWIFSERENGW